MNKKFVVTLIITIILILIVIVVNIIVKNIFLTNNKNEYEFICEFTEEDSLKKSTYRYIVNTDEFSLIKKVKRETIYLYNDNIEYEEAKQYLGKSEVINEELKYTDSENKIYKSYYEDERIYNNSSYYSFVNQIDKKYKCGSMNFQPITYECSKNETYESYSIDEKYTIISDNEMNIQNIDKYKQIKYENESEYNENKENTPMVEGKRYEDSTKSVIYEQNLPLVDENGEIFKTNIKNYIDNLGKEYTCKKIEAN